jgi:hypothetical protein
MTAARADWPIPPIFVNDHGDVSAFRSVRFAESWMEPIDIENREYTAYDASGRLLALAADRRRVQISLAEQEPTHSEELAASLYTVLRERAVPITTDLADSPFGKTFTFRDPDGYLITVHDDG